MPHFTIAGTRQLTITQSGEAWVEADSLEAATEIAESDPESLDWAWDAISEEDADDFDDLTIKSIKTEAEAEDDEDEDEEAVEDELREGEEAADK